jgi:hypothetical protein
MKPNISRKRQIIEVVRSDDPPCPPLLCTDLEGQGVGLAGMYEMQKVTERDIYLKK